MVFRRFRQRVWQRRINLIVLVMLVSIPVAYVTVALATGERAFDYGKMMYAADLYCYDNAAFSYTLRLETWYPAPYYTTFCWPHRHLEPLFYVVWMLAPIVLTLWLARGRALALTFAPLGDMVLLGQNTWMLLPLYLLGRDHKAGQRVPWWHGLVLAIGALKPHIALPVWLWLGWRWRGQWKPYLAWLAGMIALAIPAFLIRPTWLTEWLLNSSQGRGTEAAIGRGSVALIPDRPDLPMWIVYLFCALVAVAVYLLLKRRRGTLTFYDWTLLYVFASPVMNDYDLIVLLPFILGHRRRLAVTLTAGIAAWAFALMTGRWSMSVMITLALIVERWWRPGPRTVPEGSGEPVPAQVSAGA